MEPMIQHQTGNDNEARLIVEAHLDRLDNIHSNLLYDVPKARQEAVKRMAFLAAPPEATTLFLEGFPNVKLGSVSGFTNLRCYTSTKPGFPTGQGDIFHGICNERAQVALDKVTTLLHGKLVEIEHAQESQGIHVYASVLQSDDYEDQGAHRDFPKAVVDPFQDETKKRGRRQSSLPYKYRVPFIAVFALTDAGMDLEIWEARGPDHMPTTTDGCGTIVHLPFGTMALMRGDVFHAGGFMTDDSADGNPRAHLYVYRDDGELHESPPQNDYKMPALPDGAGRTKTMLYADLYKPNPQRVML